MELTRQVCEIVRRASEIMKERPHDIVQKGNASDFVTDADVHVQKVVTEELLKLLPESAVLGEESGELPKERDLLWIVDPIDGTSNFIRDLGASCISVGLMNRDELVSGVIYNPFRNEMFYGAKGQGAYVNGHRMRVSDRDFAHSHLCSAMSIYDKRHTKTCLDIIGEVYQQSDDLRRFGAASFETAQLAAGRVELYFEMKICPWDVAAGALLIEEAGGVWECLYHNGMAKGRKFPFIAANNPENFAKLREIVTRHIPEIPYDDRLF